MSEHRSCMTPYEFVVDGYESPVSQARTWVERKILEAEMELESRLGPLHVWVNRQRYPHDSALRIQVVVARAVHRLLRDPAGIESESDGEYTYSRRTTGHAPGEVTITPKDWAYLGAKRSGGPRVIRLSLPADSPRNMTGVC